MHYFAAYSNTFSIKATYTKTQIKQTNMVKARFIVTATIQLYSTSCREKFLPQNSIFTKYLKAKKNKVT